jgi:hypothetical protein
MDVGVYFSQVFVTNHPSLRWEQPMGSKRFVDYGQPMLVNFGATGSKPLGMNPIAIVLASAYGIARRGAANNSLFDFRRQKKLVR